MVHRSLQIYPNSRRWNCHHRRLDLDPFDIALAGRLGGYHLFHATRAELLRALGHPDQARAADERALQLTMNPAEQALLRRRIR